MLITYGLDSAHRETALEGNVIIKICLKPFKNLLFQAVKLGCASHLGQSAAAVQLLAGENNTP